MSWGSFSVLEHDSRPFLRIVLARRQRRGFFSGTTQNMLVAFCRTWCRRERIDFAIHFFSFFPPLYGSYGWSLLSFIMVESLCLPQENCNLISSACFHNRLRVDGRYRIYVGFAPNCLSGGGAWVVSLLWGFLRSHLTVLKMAMDKMRERKSESTDSVWWVSI
jgi:hypothetical protein